MEIALMLALVAAVAMVVIQRSELTTCRAKFDTLSHNVNEIVEELAAEWDSNLRDLSEDDLRKKLRDLGHSENYDYYAGLAAQELASTDDIVDEIVRAMRHRLIDRAYENV